MSELITVLAQSVNLKYCYLSYGSLLYYDTILNFADEYQFIWKAGWSLGKVLYIMARYFAFVDLTLLLTFDLDPHLDPAGCMRVYKAAAWMQVVGVLVAESLLIIRTYAIFQRNKYILAYLVCLKTGLTIPSIKIINDSFSQTIFIPSPAPRVFPCLPISGNGKYWPAFLCIAIFDLNIVSLTLFKAISSWRGGSYQARLIKTLYRDGGIYFICLFATSVTNVVLLRTMTKTPYFFLLVGFQRVMHGLLTSRLIINVRKASSQSWTDGKLSDPLDDTDIGRGMKFHSPNSGSTTGMRSEDSEEVELRESKRVWITHHVAIDGV